MYVAGLRKQEGLGFKEEVTGLVCALHVRDCTTCFQKVKSTQKAHGEILSAEC